MSASKSTVAVTPNLRDLMALGGRRAVVTGAGGHLGRSMAAALAELGAELILVDRPRVDVSHHAKELSERWTVPVHVRACDLEGEAERQDLVGWLSSEFRNIHVLVNNAAFVGTSDLEGWAVGFEHQGVDAWRRAIEVNLTAVFSICRGIAPLMRGIRGASVINIASIYGLLGPDWRLYEGTTMANPAAYAASKGGLIQLTRWLASTLGPSIRVNAISPGGIYRNQPDVFVERYSAGTPLARMATEQDFIGAIAYLATDLSLYVTGQNLVVDGGRSVW